MKSQRKSTKLKSLETNSYENLIGASVISKSYTEICPLMNAIL